MKLTPKKNINKITINILAYTYRPINNSINNDLDWVEVSEQMDDFHGVSNNPDSHELLPVVSSVHHKRVRKPLNNGALGLPESLH